MELYEDRIINGLLKANTINVPEEATELLARDIVIVAPPERATEDEDRKSTRLNSSHH